MVVWKVVTVVQKKKERERKVRDQIQITHKDIYNNGIKMKKKSLFLPLIEMILLLLWSLICSIL